MSETAGLLERLRVMSGALRVMSHLRYLHENTAQTAKIGGEACAEAEAKLRECVELLGSPAEFEDERLSYVTIQVPREVWIECRALAEKEAGS